MRQILTIARWEFLTTISRRTFLVAVIATPLLWAGLAGVRLLASHWAGRGADDKPVALVDAAGVVDIRFAAEQAASHAPPAGASAPAEGVSTPVVLAPYQDLAVAMADLRQARVSAVYVIPADYRQRGELTSYERDGGLFGVPSSQRRLRSVTDAVRVSLLKPVLTGEALGRAYAPGSRLRRMHVDEEGRVVAQGDGLAAAGPFVGAFGIFFLFTMAIFFSAGFLQQATSEERQSKMLEVVLSSVAPEQLLMGKILGLGSVGLLQLAIYVVLLIVPGMNVFVFLSVPAGKVLLALVYFAIGYLLFASLMAGAGMLGRTPQESGQFSALWTLVAASPLFFFPIIGGAPDGLLARTLSLLPATGPVTMMLRLAVSDPPLIEHVAVILLGLFSIAGSIWGMSKLCRTASLMYGQRGTLPSLWRWLREA